MRIETSKAIAVVFFTVCATSVVGCDVSGIIATLVSQTIQSGSCGDCGACGSCDCSSCGGCAGCAVDCDPNVRDAAGRNQTFNGVHPSRRIPNAIQARLTQSGYTFLRQEVPMIVRGVLPNGIDLASAGGNGTVYVELRNFDLNPADNVCTGNSKNNIPGTHDCIRATLDAYFRTCDRTGTCTAGENVQVTVPNVPLFGSLTCTLNLDASRGVVTDGLHLTADVGPLAQTTPAVRAGYSQLAILDVDPTPSTLEGADVIVNCPDQGPYNAGQAFVFEGIDVIVQGLSVSCSCRCSGVECLSCAVADLWYCSVDPQQLVQNTVTQLQNDLDDDVDSIVDGLSKQFCTAVVIPSDSPTAAQQTNACPTNTTFAANATQVAGDNATVGVCNVDGSNPVRCMQNLLGTEARVGVGSAVAVVTPGIEAVVDMVVALAGDSETVASGSSFNLFGGMEGWIAGLRALPHNPCAAIEHPAASQADCNALGSGYEYDATPSAGFTGRCVPRIPLVPLATAVRGNAPVVAVPGLDAQSNHEVGVGVSESFVQYAAWKLWDSGALCLSVGSSLSPIMSPSLIGLALVAPDSRPRIFFPLNVLPETGGNPANANVRTVLLALRPQSAPAITFDDVDDPCEPGADTKLTIDVTLDDLAVDLSIWGDDRYARVGTFVSDVHVVVTLDMGVQAAGGSGCPALAPGQLGIAIQTLAFNDAHFLPDAPLLTPADFSDAETGSLPVQTGLNTIGGIAGGIAASLLPQLNLDTLINGLIGGLGGSLGGGTLPVFAHFDADALQVVEQPSAACQGAPYDTGVRTTDTNCTHTFLGAYVDLQATAPPTMLMGSVDTTVQVTSLTLPEDRALFDMQSPTFGQGELPTLEIAMEASGPENAVFEYSYRTTYSEWSPWQQSAYAVIRDKALLVQGNQQVQARARIVGEDASVDETPGTAELVIDVTPPMIEVYDGAHGGAQLQALDLVSTSLSYRVNEDGEWSEWQALPASGVKDLDVGPGTAIEVRDEEGNVAGRGDAIQGRPNAANSSACASCSTAGASGATPPMALAGMLAMLGVVGMRRRTARR